MKSQNLKDALKIIEEQPKNAELAKANLQRALNCIMDGSLDDWAEGFSKKEMRKICRGYIVHLRERLSMLIETIEIYEE